MLKKSYLFLIIFICLFSISIVSAQETGNETNNVLSTDVAISESNGGWYVDANATETGDGSETNPFNNLKTALDNANDGDSIYIESGIYSGMGNVNLSIDKEINICAKDSNVIFDGEKQNKFFGILASNVAINGLTFKNGYSSMGGTGTYINRALNVSITNCNFINNSDSKFGGAIFSIFSTVNVINCSFLDNFAPEGGSVYLTYSIAKFINSSFINNGAINNSAAICSFVSMNSIDNCDFINNSVTGNSPFGGAIAFYQYENNISNSRFINNSINGEYGYGSSIFNYGNLNISNTLICNNKQNTKNKIDDSIYTIIGKTNLINSIVENNSCSGDEEIIYALFWPMVFDKVLDESNRSIPTSYDLRNITLENGTNVSYVSPIKDQKRSGSCWAFGAIAALESYFLINENKAYDFSENNMKNVMGSYTDGGWIFDPNSGGGTAKSLAYWTRWSGPINESDDPYNDTSIISPTNLTVVKHVQDVVYLPVMDNTQLKVAVLDYGPVVMGYKYFDSERFEINGTIFESEVSPFNTLPRFSTHVVAIVGWDDNYPGSKFGENIPDGAFIIKNSFGESEYDSKLNKTIYYEANGYNYISYYDLTLSKENIPFAIVNVENVDNYKENYYYDPTGTLVNLGFNNETAWFSNQFISNSHYPIAAFSLYTFAVDSTYDAYIYVNDKLVHTQSGIIHNPGYNTIKLSDYIGLNENDVFRITLKLTTPNCTFPIPIECDVEEWINNTHSSPNQSFISPDGINWIDLYYNNKNLYEHDGIIAYSEFSNANVCLKAFTMDSGLFTSNLVKIYKNESKFEADVGASNIPILFEVNGVNYTRLSDENGIARLNINLNPGNYTIKTFYGNITIKNNIEVLPTLFSQNLVKYYKNESQFDILLIDGTGNAVSNVNITMNINGVFYNRTTDENGKARLNINLNPGEYILTAIDPLTGLIMSYNITVLPVLSASDIDMKYRDGTQFKATLVDGQGKPFANQSVQLNINGVFYNRLTDSSGTAKLNINLMPGEYIITSSYNGSSIANKVTVRS